MVLWVIGFGLGIWWSDRANRLTVAMWIAGLGFLVLHILLSMGVFHGWSHVEAVQATVVFAVGPTRWIGLLCGLGISLLGIYCRKFR